MTEPTSEQSVPKQPTPPSDGDLVGAEFLLTPIPHRSGVKWGRLTALTILVLGGVAWGFGWFEPLADLASTKLYKVSGTIRYNGQPLTKGFVRTIYERGGRMGTLGPINADGTFELTTNGDSGAYSGRHRVLVLCMDGGFPPKSILPEQYSDPRTSPLAIHVSRNGPNNVQLELVGAKSP
ncbi:MAG: hypothetical protein H7062_22895 [Candidatus Saccharimonas sp.]|nr:hypothetical protein [Planctomycetaceae bacterium]